MFKGFIPGKRVSSVDLGVRDDGKENRDPLRSVGKADTMRNGAKNGAPGSSEMGEAFDQLLVRTSPAVQS